MTSCKKEEKLTYLYADQELELYCNQIDTSLIKETLYSFQADIEEKYSNMGATDSYRKYTYYGMNGKAPYKEIVSKHSLEVMNELKKVDGLWNAEGSKSRLNYDHPFVACLINNFKSKDLSTTINALKSVDALSPELLESRVRKIINDVETDKYLSLYIALDSYYARIYDLTEADLKEKK
ncbi:MAG: hypothetical protein V7767_15000 [Leeuwenhoekiella sp.]